MKTDNGGQQALVPAGELIEKAPDWFQQALAEKPHLRDVAYEKTRLHYRQWDGPGTDAPNIVLLHGGGAHARWYDFIAPQLTPYYNVIALNLPGMGDSGWLQSYTRDIMAEGVITMIRDARFTAKPALIGHSMGGMVSLLTAHLYHDELAALMMCDYYVRPPKFHNEWYMSRDENGNWQPNPTRDTRIYDDFDTALARFRLQPEQPCANHYIVEYIGAHSLKEVDGGWTWKFDPHMFKDFRIGEDWPEIYRDLPLPLATMFGAQSHDHEEVSRVELIDFMRNLRPDAPHFDIVGAHHHIMLDQPHAFASAIVQQMCVWKAQGAY